MLASATTTAVAQSANAPQRTVEQRLRIIEQQLSSQALIAMMQDVRALRREAEALRGENRCYRTSWRRWRKPSVSCRATERRFQRIGTAPASSQPASGAQLAGSNESAPAPAPRSTTATSTAPAPAPSPQPREIPKCLSRCSGQIGWKLRQRRRCIRTIPLPTFSSEYAGNAVLAGETTIGKNVPTTLSTYAALIETHPAHKVPEASLKAPSS